MATEIRKSDLLRFLCSGGIKIAKFFREIVVLQMRPDKRHLLIMLLFVYFSRE